MLLFQSIWNSGCYRNLKLALNEMGKTKMACFQCFEIHSFIYERERCQFENKTLFIFYAIFLCVTDRQMTTDASLCYRLTWQRSAQEPANAHHTWVPFKVQHFPSLQKYF